MTLAWPGVRSMGGDLADEDEPAIEAVLDEFGDAVAYYLQQRGLPRHASPVFKPFSMVLIRDREKMLATFAPATGMANIDWFDRLNEAISPEGFVDFVRNRLAGEARSVLTLPLPHSPHRQKMIDMAAQDHVRVVEDEQILGQLGDLSGVTHLVPYLRQFMGDHPVYDRNVFIIMRFSDRPEIRQIHASIKPRWRTTACGASGPTTATTRASYGPTSRSTSPVASTGSPSSRTRRTRTTTRTSASSWAT